MKKKKIMAIGVPLVYTKLMDIPLHLEYFLHHSGIILNNSSEFFVNIETAISDEEDKDLGFVIPIICQKTRILVLCHKCSYIFPDRNLSNEERNNYIQHPSWIGPIPIQETQNVSGLSDEIVLERRPYEELKQQLILTQAKSETKILHRLRNVLMRKLENKPLSVLRKELFNFGRSYKAKHPDGVIKTFIDSLVEKLTRKQIEEINQKLSQPETLEEINVKLKNMFHGKLSNEEINQVLNDPEFITRLNNLKKHNNCTNSSITST